MKTLKELYYSPAEPSAYSSVKKLVNASGKTKKEVQKWLRGQETYTVFRQARKKFKRRKILTSGPWDLLQADLAEMGSYANKNNGFKYLLFIIDCFTKFLWVKPLKTKQGAEMCKALTKWFQEVKKTPDNFQTDKGKEFWNKDVTQLMKEHKVNFYSSEDPDVKAAIAERSIRTLKGRIYRYMKAKNTNRYINVLPDLVKSYNNSVHRSIGMKPSEVNERNKAQVMSKLYPRSFRTFPPKYQFAVGQKVRVLADRTPFTKGYFQQYSQEIYEIATRRPTDPVTYTLKDWFGNPIHGQYYEPEIIAVDEPEFYAVEKILKKRKSKRGQECLVKWMGLPEDQAQWIPIEDVKTI